MNKPDFTYRKNGLFTKIFAETSEAEAVWNEQIAPQTENTGNFLTIHFPAVKHQLEEAGWVVQKAKKVKESDEKLLKDLGLS